MCYWLLVLDTAMQRRIYGVGWVSRPLLAWSGHRHSVANLWWGIGVSTSAGLIWTQSFSFSGKFMVWGLGADLCLFDLDTLIQWQIYGVGLECRPVLAWSGHICSVENLWCGFGMSTSACLIWTQSCNGGFIVWDGMSSSACWIWTQPSNCGFIVWDRGVDLCLLGLNRAMQCRIYSVGWGYRPLPAWFTQSHAVPDL